MTLLKNFFQNRTLKRLVILVLLALILFGMRSMLNLILFTFIFTFLMNQLQMFITTKFHLNRKFVVIVLYGAAVAGLVIGIYRIFPVVTVQIAQLIKLVKEFYKHPPSDPVISYVADTIKKIEVTNYMDQGFDFLYRYITNVGKLGMEILFALMLSFFFLLEKPRIVEFTKKFKNSKISAFYYEMAYFGTRFARSFGKVIEAQFLIAIVNSVLSVIALWIMGFPQLIGLGLMIFFLGLIPVAGVIISLIPLCTIAYSIGGVTQVMWIIVMIIVLHALESYVLNPKLMSSKTDLPVFYTFIILIFSEHFLGVWGLIIGIPIFMFLLDVLGVTHDPENDQA
ncbi:AI-2E family transporter [Microbacteriaceae bacterium 4G12]